MAGNATVDAVNELARMQLTDIESCNAAKRRLLWYWVERIQQGR